MEDLTSPPRVSIVVPARDAADTLGRALECLRAQALGEPYEVVVVDKGSRDGTAALAEAAGPPVRLVRAGPGAAGEARNEGAAAARGDMLAFTDADCFPRPGWLAAGVAALRGGGAADGGSADLVIGRVEPDPSTPMGPFDRSLWADRDDGLHRTANLFVTRAAFERAGGFADPGLVDGRPFGEDVLFGWRVRRGGGRAVFAPDAVVDHAVERRGAAAYVAERLRLSAFPPVARAAPELRGSFFFGRVFLSSRSAAFDAALAGLAAAALTRRRAPLAAALPYAAMIARRAAQSGPRAPLAAPVEVAADAVALAALLRGSVAAGTLVA